MIALRRTSRDHCWFILPILVLIAAVPTYVSLAAYGFAPLFGTIYFATYWLAPLASIVLWCLLSWYVYRLFVPVVYRIEIHADRIILHDSSRADDAVVLRRRDVKRFFVERSRWWHNSESPRPVVYETCANEIEHLSMNFVYDDVADEFFEAVGKMWGSEYVPAPKPPGLASKEIRFWPKFKKMVDGRLNARETSEATCQ